MRKIWLKRFPKLMQRLILYFFVIIMLMFSLNAFTMYRFRQFYSSVYMMLDEISASYLFLVQTDQLYNSVVNYRHTGNTDYLLEFDAIYNEMAVDIAARKQEARDKGHHHFRFYRDLTHMLATFGRDVDALIVDIHAGVPSIYLNRSVNYLARLVRFMQDVINNLLIAQILEMQTYYSDFQRRMNVVEGWILLITVFITIACLYFSTRVSKHIALPLYKLASHSRTVAQGVLEPARLDVKNDDEIGILVESFNYMIAELKQSFEVEKQLHEQKVKNLEMANLLNEAELNLLQSQINPHFLFNTLNSVSALADIERASQTKTMLDSLSVLLRYNVTKINSVVTLGEEYEIVKSYLHIQRVRFDERLRFSTFVDEEALSEMIPSMIMQPFVENSIIHGLEPKEGHGELNLRITKTPSGIEIKVTDNGLGIPREKLDSILESTLENDQPKSDNSRIGVRNVLRRLKIYYGFCPVKIESIEGVGTSVTITLDKKSIQGDK